MGEDLSHTGQAETVLVDRRDLGLGYVLHPNLDVFEVRQMDGEETPYGPTSDYSQFHRSASSVVV